MQKQNSSLYRPTEKRESSGSREVKLISKERESKMSHRDSRMTERERIMNSTMDKEMSKMKTMTNLRTKLDQQRLAQTLIDD